MSLPRVVTVLSGLWAVQTAMAALVHVYIAAHYGAGVALDVYLAGITIPNTIYMVLSSGLGVATITFFHERRARAGHDEACRDVTGVCIAASASALVLVIAVLLFARPLTAWLVSGFPVSSLERVNVILRLTAPCLPLLVAATVLQGLLQATHHYYSVALASLVQVGLLPVFLALGGPALPEVLAWGYDAAAVASFVVLAVAASKLRLLRVTTAALPAMRRLVALSAPLMWAGVCTHLVWVIERHLASSLEVGAISALVYAQRVVNIVAGGVAFGLATVLLPLISERLESGHRDLAGILNRKALLLLTAGATLGAAVLLFTGPWLVRLGFERGAFDRVSTVATAGATQMYVGVFIAHVLGAAVIRNAMAAKESRLVTVGSVALLGSYAIVAPLLADAHGLNGLALAASVAYVLSSVVYAAVMLMRHPYLYLRGTARANQVRTPGG